MPWVADFSVWPPAQHALSPATSIGSAIGSRDAAGSWKGMAATGHAGGSSGGVWPGWADLTRSKYRQVSTIGL